LPRPEENIGPGGGGI